MQGSNFARYAKEMCLPQAPLQTRSTIRAMIDSQDLRVTASACKLITNHTIKRMQGSFQPFFDGMYASSENVGSALDYLLRVGTMKDSMQDLCTNYQTNPFVVAIIPEPVDYFRACGMTSVCRSRCRAEIEEFELVNENPSIVKAPYTVRSESPFFLDLDEGSVTPMTIVALTEVTDCEYICGQRPIAEAAGLPENGDRCVSIAGTVGDSDLTIMSYCIPSTPGVGVWRSQAWTVPGTLKIMNDVVDIKFADFQRGEVVVMLRDDFMLEDGVTSSTSGFFGSRLTSRINLFKRGDTFTSDLVNQPLVQEAEVESVAILAARAAESFSEGGLNRFPVDFRSHRFIGIDVQPAETVILHAQVQGVSVLNAGTPDEIVQTKRFNLCGPIPQQTSVRWSVADCHKADVWTDAADLGHVVWIQDMPWTGMVVPGSGILTSGTGQVRIIQVSPAPPSQQPKEVKVVGIRPFKSSMWSLLAGIPATSRDLDFSMSTRAIVRKNQVVSQLGRVKPGQTEISTTVPSRMETFMSNSPSSPSHWLSQIRLNIPANSTVSSTGSPQGDLVTAGVYQGTEITQSFVLLQKCNFQVCFLF